MPGLRIKSVTLGFIKIIVDDYLYMLFLMSNTKEDWLLTAYILLGVFKSTGDCYYEVLLWLRYIYNDTKLNS